MTIDPGYQRKKDWRNANKEKARAASRNWKKNNRKHKVKSTWQERRAAILACVSMNKYFSPATVKP